MQLQLEEVPHTKDAAPYLTYACVGKYEKEPEGDRTSVRSTLERASLSLYPHPRTFEHPHARAFFLVHEGATSSEFFAAKVSRPATPFSPLYRAHGAGFRPETTAAGTSGGNRTDVSANGTGVSAHARPVSYQSTQCS